MPLNANVVLMGDLDNYRLEGDAMNAMNELYDRVSSQGADFLGGLDSDAKLGKETGLRHWTCKKPAQTIFFAAGNSTGAWRVQVYGHGKHPGDDNKEYALYTWEHGGKSKLYRF